MSLMRAKTKAYRALSALLLAFALGAWPGQVRPAPAAGGPVGMAPIRGDFTPMAQGSLNADPDFPILLLRNGGEGFPRMMLVVLDARGADGTWSLGRHPAIFLLVEGEGPEGEHALLDRGFADSGTPSGEFLEAGADGVDALVAKLVESHRRLVETSLSLPLDVL